MQQESTVEEVFQNFHKYGYKFIEFWAGGLKYRMYRITDNQTRVDIYHPEMSNHETDNKREGTRQDSLLD